MATKPKAGATTIEASAPSAARVADRRVPRVAATAKPITDFVSVWVHHFDTALAGKQTGFVFATRADAARMIADGDAILAGDLSFSGPMIGPRPALEQPGPDPEPVAVVLKNFTAQDPALASVSLADGAKIHNGDLLLMYVTGGYDADARAYLNNKIMTVQGLTTVIDHVEFTIGHDFTSFDTTGLTANGTVQPPWLRSFPG